MNKTVGMHKIGNQSSINHPVERRKPRNDNKGNAFPFDLGAEKAKALLK